MYPKRKPKPSLSEKCRAIGQRNKLDPEAVEIFIANHEPHDFMVINRRTGKPEPIANELHLERLLCAFARAFEHQSQ